MSFGFLLFEVPTLREKNFAGTNFCKFCSWIFRGNDFCYLEFTKDLTEINIRGHNLYKDFEGIKFCGCLNKKNFPWPYFLV